jgi:hypothetical protein
VLRRITDPALDDLHSRCAKLLIHKKIETLFFGWVFQPKP